MTDTQAPEPRRTFRDRWTGFWFAPADPTPLAFMRVCTGLVLLYVLFAYSFDLTAFFGKDAWYNLAVADRERKEYPTMLADWTSWDDAVRAASLPEFPHRRQAVLGFVRGLPGEQFRRAEILKYVARLQQSNNPSAVRDGLLYLDKLGTAGESRKARLDALEDEKLRTVVDAIPDQLTAMPPPERAVVRKEIETLLDAMPKDVYQRQFVLNHFIEMDLPQRKLFLEFLNDLPQDPAERDKVLGYLEFWNNEARKAYALGTPVFSVWFHITDPAAMKVTHGVFMAVVLLFTLGLFTRVTSVLTWLISVSYMHRTNHVLFGMDTMMNILLLYIMIGPSGAAVSLDRLLDRWRAAKASLGRAGRIDPACAAFLAAPPKSAGAALAIRLVQVHFCFIYMASGMSKLKGPAWWNTTAFWDTLANPEFTLMQYQWYESLIRWMTQYRPAFGFACAAGVVFTFVMELGLPFLIWTRLRPVMIVGSAMLHAGIGVFMGLHAFALLMMTMLISYVPGGVIRRSLGGDGTGGKLAFAFDPADPAASRAAAWAVALDLPGRLTLTPTAGATPTLTLNGTAVPRPDWPRTLLAPLGPAGAVAARLPFVRRVWG